MASIIRESSPPDATFPNGFFSSPGFVDTINSTSSKPSGGFASRLMELESLLNDFNRDISEYMDDFVFDEKLSFTSASSSSFFSYSIKESSRKRSSSGMVFSAISLQSLAYSP